MSNDEPLRPIGTRFEQRLGEWMVTYEVLNHMPKWDGGGWIEILREVGRVKIGKPSETKG